MACVVSAGLTVLNKSKWKGGTLQIETAKESFLHRYSHLTVKVFREVPAILKEQGAFYSIGGKYSTSDNL